MSLESENPLLQTHDLPPFSKILPEHVLPAIAYLTRKNQEELAAQLAALRDAPAATVDWDTLVRPLEEREDRLSQAWSPVSHLNGVANSEALREAYEQCLPILSAYNTAMGQNAELYRSYEALRASAGFAHLSAAQQQTVANAIRNFKLAGVALEAEAKDRYAQIQVELSSLSNQFSNNVLDATQGWFKHVTDESQLAGLPEQAVKAAAKAARARALEGWVFTLDGPVYIAVMTQAEDRALREEMYTAYVTRASDQGPKAGEWNNDRVIEQILALRAELALLLGFDNYAELSIASKMAESADQVRAFLEDLARETKPFAVSELEDLRAWVDQRAPGVSLEVWDVPYYSERMKEALFDTSQEALRPYFPMAKVQQGLFELVERLFGVNIQAEQDFDSWHPDVEFFRIERDGEPKAYFYLDAYAREGKRGGAWMGECRVRRATVRGVQLPVAYLVCNFSAPMDDAPSLLTHNEVTTLFHEFGHGLHHMLTSVDVAAVSGINGVAWDAVELPSQFMENWCWEPQVLKSISGHWQSGEPLPEAEIAKLQKAKNYQSAMMMLRQLEFATFDLRLHQECGGAHYPGVQALLDDVRQTVSVIQPPVFNRFQNSFSHIFAGGYAAGYYSYKWAEVLSADAYAAFEEQGLFNPAVGERFLKEILEQGGAREAMALFKRFRGREPRIDALLRHSGLKRTA